MTEKPIPQALYGCHFCSDEYSHPADELFWSESFRAWVCDSCWRDHVQILMDFTDYNRERFLAFEEPDALLKILYWISEQ